MGSATKVPVFKKLPLMTGGTQRPKGAESRVYRMKKSALLVMVALLVLSSFTSLAEAKGGGVLRQPPVWAAATPDEEIVEMLKTNYGNSTADILAIHLPKKVGEIKGEIGPNLKKTLLKHAGWLLEQMKRCNSYYTVNNVKKALIFYQQKVGFDPGLDLNSVAHDRLVKIGQEALEKVKENNRKWHSYDKRSKIDTRELNREHHSLMGELDGVFRSGVTFEELRVTAEQLRDLDSRR